MQFIKGDNVEHPNWGIGRVLEHANNGNVRVHFNRFGEKLFRQEFANLTKISKQEHIKDKFPRRDISEEIPLVATFINDAENVSRNDRLYLTFFKEQILESLNEVLEAIGDIPSIQLPDFTRWTTYFSAGTENSELIKGRLAEIQTLEKRRRRSYLKDRKEYEDIVGAMIEEVEKQQGAFAWLIENFERALIEPIVLKPTKLHWKLLPEEETSFSHIISHFECLSKQRSDIVVDTERLNMVYSLNPDSIYIGTDEFEGYLVFYFNKASKAVLECAVSGNAIYVIKENWEELCRLSKHELLNFHRDKVTRIIHNGAWFNRLKSVLQHRLVRRADLTLL